MSTKHDDTCLQNAGDDEPIFVLRAHDMLAADVVRHWAERARAEGTPRVKVIEALDLADRMDRWQREHGSKVPD